MTIMMRLTRLFKADMHGLLDLLEEPEAVLKQAIRDMETEIEQGEQALAKRVQREGALRGTAAHLEQAVTTLEGQIDVAFEAQNEALARTFIRKKLETENRLHAATRAIADMAAATDTMQNKLRDQKTQLDAIVANMPHYASEESYASSPVGLAVPTYTAASGGVAEEDVEAAFLREQRKRADSAGRN